MIHMLTKKIQLEPDEKILTIIRKHWFVISVELVSVLFIAILPYAFYLLSSNFGTVRIDEMAPLSSLIALYCAWLLMMWMVLFSVWTHYYLDIWTITTKRLITIEQKQFFFRTTSSFRLEKLQDISVSIDGIIPTLLDYGSVEIQTAGIDPFFRGTGLPSPTSLKAMILEAQDALLALTKTSEKRFEV